MLSCIVEDDFIDNSLTLEEIVQANELWYVDYNRTTGSGNIPFLSKAFTLSFRNGVLYANNNLVGIGSTGNGFGIPIGNYDTYNGFLEIYHDIDGYYDLDVYYDDVYNIRINDPYTNTTYYLEGYSRNSFDYDQVFYDNIEYFLQEYVGWEKTFVSDTGSLNEFDNENYLAFTPENITTFYSSQDPGGVPIDNVLWDFTGSYEVFDAQGYSDLKILTLDYDDYGTEEFELSVINDGIVSLYHINSGTTYEFSGREFIQYLRTGSSDDKDAKTINRKDRERTKVKRKVKERSPKKDFGFRK